MDILIWGKEKALEKIMTGGGIRPEDILGFIEIAPKEAVYKDKPVYLFKNIPDSYDLLFIADKCNEDSLVLLKENHIPLEKVCFFDIPVKYIVDISANFEKCASFLSDEFLTMVQGYDDNDKYNFVNSDLERYNKLNKRETMSYSQRYKKFVYMDKYEQAGTVRNYFWQDLWAAKLIYESNPVRHYDIGSRIDGFIAHLLSFRENIVLIDVRPLEAKIPGLGFVHADATNLEGIEDNSIESLSALCSLEHFGLGRYGDSIDPEACFKAFAAIQRKIMPGGMAYISVPVGKEHVEFNAHRIFYAETIINAFNNMELVRFDVVSGNVMEYDVDIHKFDNCEESGCKTFGLFQFRKKT